MSNQFSYGDIIYHDIVPINLDTMGTDAIQANSWINMAETVQKIPVHLSEFKHVCRFMPIVFSPVGKPIPIAITGLTPGKNPFIINGQWKRNTYIPAAIRQYPFLLAQTDEDNKRVVYVDQSMLNKEHENRLFRDDGTKTPFFENAIEQCTVYDQHVHKTHSVIDVIDEIGLFTETQMDIETPDGTHKRTGSFKVIDVKKYAALSDEQILLLHQSQALWAIHAHIISMDNLPSIAQTLQ